MAGIQQEFQELLKKTGDKHPLWLFIKDLARIAGVWSTGLLVNHPTSLQSQAFSILSPRHEFLRQFDIALTLSYEIEQNQEKLKKHADIWPDLEKTQSLLKQHIQEEFTRCSAKFRLCYVHMCQSTCTSESFSGVTVADVRDFFCIPTIDDAGLTDARKQISLTRSSIGSSGDVKKAKESLQTILNHQDQGKAQALAQAGYAAAIEKLYSQEPNKAVACHLVNALSFSNMPGIQQAIDLLNFAEIDSKALNFLLNMMVEVLPLSVLSIEGKHETKAFLYEKIKSLKNPENFLSQLLMIEMFFLKTSLTELLTRENKQRSDTLFTVGYLLQLACVRLYDCFKAIPSCKKLCEDLLALRAEIGGKDKVCYYASPENVLRAGRDEWWALDRFESSDRLTVLGRSTEKSGCLVM